MSDTLDMPSLRLVTSVYDARPSTGQSEPGLGERFSKSATLTVHDDMVCNHWAVLMNADMLIEMECQQEIAEIDSALAQLQHLMENDK